MSVVAQSPVDLDSRERIDAFVDLFYQQMLSDEILAPIFVDVAGIDLAVHLPHIKDYWSKLLLGEESYRRHTMNIHRQLHSKRALEPADFERWLQTFVSTVDANFSGHKAERAKRVATSIAANMRKSLQLTP
ncbi:MAG: group III truncated hemoglobin [Halieaceae bacterium]